MSAANWAICPRCLKRAEDAAEAVMATYGMIPVEEFDAKRAALVDVDPEAKRRRYDVKVRVEFDFETEVSVR